MLGPDAFRSGSAVWVASPQEAIAAYPEWAPAVASGPDRAWVALPLIVDGRTRGALGLAYFAERDFTPGYRELMLSVAERCALALDRALALDEARRSAAALARSEAALRAVLEQLRLARDAAGLGSHDYASCRGPSAGTRACAKSGAWARTSPSPSRPSQKPRPAASPLAAASEAGRLDVLIVEDNEDAGETLAEILGLMGHATRVVRTGQEGIREIQRSCPQVLLCDVGLPDMTGHKVIAAARAAGHAAAPYAIALTGYAQQAGFDAHLSKPPDLDELQRLFARVGGGPEHRSSPA
ncbi:MAG: response regulator [Anaeromyxobacter sp.]